MNSSSVLASEAGQETLEILCRELDLDPKVLERLTEALLEQSGKVRRRGLHERFDEILDEAFQERHP